MRVSDVKNLVENDIFNEISDFWDEYNLADNLSMLTLYDMNAKSYNNVIVCAMSVENAFAGYTFILVDRNEMDNELADIVNEIADKQMMSKFGNVVFNEYYGTGFFHPKKRLEELENLKGKMSKKINKMIGRNDDCKLDFFATCVVPFDQFVKKWRDAISTELFCPF